MMNHHEDLNIKVVCMKLKLSGICCLSLLMANIVHAAVIRVNADQPQFVVKLPSNPTTGYQWSVTDYNKNCFSLKESHYLAAKKKLIGSGGEMVFTFNNLHGQKACNSSTIVFSYARPWESKRGQVKKVVIQLTS